MSKPAAPQLKPIRDGFGEGFLELGNQNNSVVGMSADLAESVRMQEFADKFPDRFFQIGIAEQNMAVTAVGMAVSGFIPYIGSFACFQPMRNLDQIRTSICMMNANVKIISSHAGFSHAADGIQIQELEDMGIMRMLPNMHVWVPADAEQARQMAVAAAQVKGPVYIRLGRSDTPILSKLSIKLEDFEIGKGQWLRTGTNLTFIANGYMAYNALLAAGELAKQKVQAGVLNLHTIKPVDEAAILDAADTGLTVTWEEHQIAGGLGSLVTEVLAKHNKQCRVVMIGVNDQFGDTAATSQELWQRYGLDVASVLKKLKEIL